MLEAIAVHRLAERIGRPPGVAILDQLDPEQEAAAAHVADRLVALREGFEMALEAGADRARLLRHVLAFDHFEAGDTGGAGERVVAVRMGRDKPARGDLFLDLRGRGERANADAA